jgi:hypothetical protein
MAGSFVLVVGAVADGVVVAVVPVVAVVAMVALIDWTVAGEEATVAAVGSGVVLAVDG